MDVLHIALPPTLLTALLLVPVVPMAWLAFSQLSMPLMDALSVNSSTSTL
jgi:hypothetical protein